MGHDELDLPADADPSADTEIDRAHAAAISSGEPCYLDPSTGLLVFTSATLRARGECCGSGCRHCPYPDDEQRRAGRPEAAG